MNSASEAETLRVRLLSTAQHKQANATARGPTQDCSTLDACPDGHDKTMPPAIIASMPTTILRSAFSLNTIHASTAVSTGSRLSINDAVAPLVRVNPSIRATGPRIPPNTIAPPSHGHSLTLSPDFFQPRSRIKRSNTSPMPLPRYNNPASSTGGISVPSSFASGVLAPNSAAAANA